jgi:hypothetical protein
MARDVESSRPTAASRGRQPNSPENPYADLPPPLPRWDPRAFLPRGLWMGGSLYFMHKMDVYHNIMRSPDIRHEWFKIGLACSVGKLRYQAAKGAWTFAKDTTTIQKLTQQNPSHVSIFFPSCTHTTVPALLFLKSYVELYVGKLQHKEISYKTMPQSTHASIVLLLVAGIAFQVALWPVYGGGKSIIIMFFLVPAFLINFCLMFPTVVQNMIALVVLTFFMQEYQ